MSICIYCLEDKNEMNREHVVPVCYGTFTDNLVLIDTVCMECNQYFGNNIDLYLGRDTIEGVERFKHGIKSEGKLKRQRVRFKIEQGPLRGMIATAVQSQQVQGEIDIDPVMQVGFFNNITQGYDYFEPKDIPSAQELSRKGYEFKDKEKPIHMVAKDYKGIEYIVNILKQSGMEIAVAGETDWPDEVKTRAKTLVGGEIRVDSIIFRGMAKIAFNYLAYTAGKRFALNESFNEIRAFIRHGTGRSLDYCDVNQTRILYEEKRYKVRFTQGHLIIVEWQGSQVVSKVSIFNMNTHRIYLCNYYRGIIRDITSGHHFDIASNTVTRLGHISKGLII